MEIGQFIVKTPGTCGGRARLAGRRIPVSSVYRWFLSGFDPEDISEKYEGVTLAEIYAAHPDPPDAPRRKIDLRDRKAARRAIVGKLRKRRA